MLQWDRLLADIGGLLGLFIGVSACTAVEVLEFLVDGSLLLGKLIFRKDKKSVNPIYPSNSPPSGKQTNVVHVSHY